MADDVIAAFEQWVKMGAPDPRAGAAKSVVERNKESAENFWSFQAPKQSKLPSVSDAAWPRSAIDRFTLAAMEEKSLHPVMDADPRALLRRVYFDLIGMPPTMEEANAFVGKCADGEDAQRKAFEEEVDKLLASPQFGERWGRHWLDVARYAESAGKESNNLFPTAWRYRDYVISALNTDKPYDQFLREQIAGDLLPSKTAAEHNEHLIATAFLAMGSKNIVEKNRLVFKMDLVDEQIDVCSRAALGLTVSCARCHDHKYDPVTMKDYYGLAGIFRSTETHYGTHGKKNKGLNSSTLLPLADESSNYVDTPQVASGKAADEDKPKKKKAAKQAEKNIEEQTPKQMMHEVMGVRDGGVMDSPIYLKGETDDPGPVVPRGVVAVLCKTAAPAMPAAASGRLQLAQWLTSRDNPLTARVMVNRAWQHLFGQGIVRTADNFGATGERPTHPELLDNLALSFMQDGWSVKKLVRQIVLSRTYQLSTFPDTANTQVDPGNHLLWRSNPRRLDAEAIRDAMLVAAGTMDLKAPGGSMVASLGDGFASQYSSRFVNAQFHYRSVYLPIVRDFVPECLEVFDFAEPSLVVANRDSTNVPSQALYLMNNDFVIEQAKALAHRICAVANVDQMGRIELAYQHALCRWPNEAERVRADNFLSEEAKGLSASSSAKGPSSSETAFATFCQALLASAEFRYLADAKK